MPMYHYEAKIGPQEVKEGDLEAENRAEALSQLIGLGYTPVRIDEVGSAQKAVSTRKAVKGKVSVRELNQFTRQFASLMRSQVPVLKSLQILKQQTGHGGLKAVIDSIGQEIQQGQALSEAMEGYPKVFSPLYVSLIRSGEVSGMLDKVMDRLAIQADQEEALRSKVQASLAYPLFIGVVGLGTIVFLLTFVMPRLIRMFGSFGGELPAPTKLLMAVSHGMGQTWFWGGVVFCVVGALILLRVLGEGGRLMIDRAKLGLPVMGPLVRQVELARFSRAFGLLLGHGVPVLRATEIAIPVVTNRMLRNEFRKLPGALRDGGSLAVSLKALALSAPLFVNTVAVGEEGGRVGEALDEVAQYYEQEAERTLGMLSALLEPAIILVVGGIVGFIVMAVLLPVFEMSVMTR